MHRFPEVTMAGLMNPVQPTSKVKLSAEEEAELAAYRLTTGELCQPSEHIFQCILKASGDFQVQGRGKRTYKDAVKGGLLVYPDFIPHQQKDYDILAAPVRIQRARIVRHRPWLKEWELSFRLDVLDEGFLPLDVLNGILVRAGQTVGLGDWRPRYGRFTVTKWEAV